MEKNKGPLVASFDVGVKNLAFCVLRYDADAEDNEHGCRFPIISWNCFDLTEDADAAISTHICEGGNKKTKASCTNGAKIITDDGHYFCGVHNPDKKRYTAPKPKKVGSFSYDKLGNALMDRLDAFRDVWNTVDHVIIEQQFSRNRKMIFLSAILFSYFIQIGQRNPESSIKHVKFASSRNKLLVYNGPRISEAERTRKNDKDHRKWLAIKHCEWMIRHDTEHLAFFHRYPKKKDDLSDCFLQGADYLVNDCRAVKRPGRKPAAKKKKANKKTTEG